MEENQPVNQPEGAPAPEAPQTPAPEQAQPEMPEPGAGKAEPKGKKKGGLLLKLLIAIVLIGVVAALVVFGAQGGWFQGNMFSRSKLKTVAPIQTVTQLETVTPVDKKFDSSDKHAMLDKELSVKELDAVKVIEKEVVAKEVDKLVTEDFDRDDLQVVVPKDKDDFATIEEIPAVVSLPPTLPGKPTVKITFLDYTGGGFVDDSIYGQQTPHSNDVMMAFKVEVIGDAGAWVELDELELGSVDPLSVNHGGLANFQLGRFGKLVRLNYIGNFVNNVTLIAEHDSEIGDDMFTSSEFVNRSWTRVNAGEEKVFAILWNSADFIPLIMNSYSDITGSVNVNAIEFVDQGDNIHNITDLFVVGTPNKTIQFK
ncbi:hypothetical protein ACFL3C_03830 [Patescibacteria group bacterium]